MNPKVSVVVPVYNTYKYLAQCLASLCQQTLQEIEIICVDDGSTDESVQLLEAYAKKDNRIQIYHHKNDGNGAANARNLGVSKSKGEYVLFLDSDDWVDKALLEKTYHKAKLKDADLIIYDVIGYDDVTKQYEYNVKDVFNRRYIPPQEVFHYRDIENCMLYQIKNGVAWNMLVRRRLIEENDLYFYPVFYTDDIFFSYTAMACAQRITVVDEKLLYYRKNVSTSQTQRMDKAPLSSSIACLKIKSWLQEKGMYEELKCSLVNMALVHFRVYLDHMNSYKGICTLFKELQEHTFKELDLEHYTADDFLREEDYKWYHDVKTLSPEEYMYHRYQNNYIYATRFKFPYQKVERGSSVILYGAGEVGKAYFIQNLTKPWCNLVGWVDREGSKINQFVESIDSLKEKEYDTILIAMEDKSVSQKVKDSLIEMGIEAEKIVL